MTRSPLSPRWLPVLLLKALMVGTPLGTWAQDGSVPTGPFGAVLADEMPVPGFIPGGEGACERFLNVGRLVLGGTGEYSLEIGHSHYCDSMEGSGGFQWRSEGHVHADEGDRLRFRPSHGSEEITGWTEGERILVEWEGMTLTFLPGEAEEVSFAEGAVIRTRERIAREAQAARSRPGVYRCEDDERALREHPEPPWEHGHLVERISTELPGWRLSTEMEIGCRFRLMDGSTPATFIPEWGSGETWWVWEGDFNDDGATDHLVLLTSDEDPSEDMLAVLFGDGSSALVAPAEGWGVSIAEREGPDEIFVIQWESSHMSYRWDGEAFEEFGPPTE